MPGQVSGKTLPIKLRSVIMKTMATLLFFLVSCHFLFSQSQIKTRTDLDVLYYLQTSYRERMDRHPAGTVEWGFYPVHGYFNEASDKPAMSNDPHSWPPQDWPGPEGWNPRRNEMEPITMENGRPAEFIFTV
jgi:hypothetical protein